MNVSESQPQERNSISYRHTPQEIESGVKFLMYKVKVKFFQTFINENLQEKPNCLLTNRRERRQFPTCMSAIAFFCYQSGDFPAPSSFVINYSIQDHLQAAFSLFFFAFKLTQIWFFSSSFKKWRFEVVCFMFPWCGFSRWEIWT